MSQFLLDLEQSEALLKHPLVSKELARVYARSVEWARSNHEQLSDFGWTVEQFYLIGRQAFPYSEWGPGWISLWNNEKSEPRLNDRGNLEFVLHEAGGDVVQTCWLVKNFVA